MHEPHPGVWGADSERPLNIPLRRGGLSSLGASHQLETCLWRTSVSGRGSTDAAYWGDRVWRRRGNCEPAAWSPLEQSAEAVGLT